MGFLSRILGGSEDTVAASPPASSAGPGHTGPDAAAPGWDVAALTPAMPETAADAMVDVDDATTQELHPKVVEALKTVFDPEIPVDIYELGLIYQISATAGRHVHVKMTLTSPACPSAQQLPSEARFKIKAIEGVSDATVDVVWEPPWDKDRMSDAAKLQLGFF